MLADALGLATFEPTPEFGAAPQGFLLEPTEERHDAVSAKCAFDLDRLPERMGARWQQLTRLEVAEAASVRYGCRCT